MAGLNKVTLIGNLGKDPEIRSLGSSGDRVASFSLATSETWKDKATGERKEATEWHNVSVYNQNLVKVIEGYVKKGSKLYIEGQLKTRKWKDKDDNDRYTTDIDVRMNGVMLMLDGRDGAAGASHTAAASTANGAKKPVFGNDDDVDDGTPF